MEGKRTFTERVGAGGEEYWWFGGDGTPIRQVMLKSRVNFQSPCPKWLPAEG